MLAALCAVPGVRSASLSLYGLACGSTRTSDFNPPGHKIPPGKTIGQENLVTPDWFRTVGIGLVKGRLFTEEDTKDAQKVVILNQAAALKFLGTDAVVGARFGYGNDQPWIIVGIVLDARVNSLRGSPPPMIFTPLAQGPAEFITMGTGLDLFRTRELLVVRLASGFGIVALLLAAIGLSWSDQLLRRAPHQRDGRAPRTRRLTGGRVVGGPSRFAGDDHQRARGWTGPLVPTARIGEEARLWLVAA
jgi:hypothetical protein